MSEIKDSVAPIAHGKYFKKIDNPYDLCLIATQRVKDLNSGLKPLILDYPGKNITLGLEEVSLGHVNIEESRLKIRRKVQNAGTIESEQSQEESEDTVFAVEEESSAGTAQSELLYDREVSSEVVEEDL
jgi:DNA-directed RNA polymerase subunit K/omega